MSGTRRALPEAFKREAVDRVRSSGLSVGAVARFRLFSKVEDRLASLSTPCVSLRASVPTIGDNVVLATWRRYPIGPSTDMLGFGLWSASRP